MPTPDTNTTQPLPQVERVMEAARAFAAAHLRIASAQLAGRATLIDAAEEQSKLEAIVRDCLAARPAAPEVAEPSDVVRWEYSINGNEWFSLSGPAAADMSRARGHHVRALAVVYPKPATSAQAERKPHPAISLTRLGIMCTVAIEVDGEWVPVIRDNGDTISHIVEPLGIQKAIDSNQRGRS